MKLFLKKATVFLTVILVTFILSIILLRSFGQKKLDLKGASTLILGDSNTECSFNDQIIKNLVNLSLSGDSYYHANIKLKKIVDDGARIDTLYLSFSPHNLFEKSFIKKDTMFPGNFEVYFPIIPVEDVKVFFNSNPKGVTYSLFKSPIRSIKMSFGFLRGVGLSKGYGRFLGLKRNNLELSMNELREKEKENRNGLSDKISSLEVKYLRAIIEECKMHSIKLVLVCTPKRRELMNSKLYNTSKFYKFYNDNLEHLDFLDYSGFVLPDEHYGDLMHLNSLGASFFSMQLSEAGLFNPEYLFKKN